MFFTPVSTTTVSDRLIAVLEESYPERGRFAALEGSTGIKAGTWKQIIAGRQKATQDAIQAIARLHPTFAFWMVTGISDTENGHTFPERVPTCVEFSLRGNLKGNESYFKAQIAAMLDSPHATTIKEIIDELERENTQRFEREKSDEVLPKDWKTKGSQYLERLQDIRRSLNSLEIGALRWRRQQGDVNASKNES